MSPEFTSFGSWSQDDATPIGSEESLMKYSQGTGQVKLPQPKMDEAAGSGLVTGQQGLKGPEEDLATHTSESHS